MASKAIIKRKKNALQDKYITDFIKQQREYLNADPMLKSFYKVCKLCGELIKKSMKIDVCSTH